MLPETLDDLRQQELITQKQFDELEPFIDGRKISVYYELRTLLYVGILLFTGGLGVLIYKNIGELGHILAIATLVIATFACFGYAIMRGPAYRHGKVLPPNGYYDYAVLLACLLSIIVQGYLQFQYALFDNALEWNTLLSAILFFAVSYRYDHTGVLALAITALASFFGLSLSPQKWYASDFLDDAQLHWIAIGLGVALGSMALWLHSRSIKQHFTFSYLNFSLILFFGGSVAGLFMENSYYIFLGLIYVGSFFAYRQAVQNHSFIFLLYAFVCAYIGTTYLLADWVFESEPTLWFYYSITSCGGFIYFIISYKKLFSRK